MSWVEDDLRRRGFDIPYNATNLMIPCPFHDETQASLSIFLEDGRFQCFGCKKTGSYAKLVAELDGIPLEDAIELVDSYIRLESFLRDPLDYLCSSLVEKDKASRRYSIESFHSVFPIRAIDSIAGRDYLKKRGIHSSKLTIQSDLRWGNTHNDYVDRVIIPIRNTKGDLITYAARSMRDDIVPKTMKPDKEEGIVVRSTLYGLYETLSRLRVSKLATPPVIVEGEFDSLYLRQFGVPAFACMGSGPITSYQIRELVRLGAHTVFLSYDGDKAGDIALKINRKLLSNFFTVRIISIPRGEDPNTLSETQVLKLYGPVIIEELKYD